MSAQPSSFSQGNLGKHLVNVLKMTPETAGSTEQQQVAKKDNGIEASSSCFLDHLKEVESGRDLQRKDSVMSDIFKSTPVDTSFNYVATVGNEAKMTCQPDLQKNVLNKIRAHLFDDSDVIGEDSCELSCSMDAIPANFQKVGRKEPPLKDNLSPIDKRLTQVIEKPILMRRNENKNLGGLILSDTKTLKASTFRRTGSVENIRENTFANMASSLSFAQAQQLVPNS